LSFVALGEDILSFMDFKFCALVVNKEFKTKRVRYLKVANEIHPNSVFTWTWLL